LNTEIDRSIRVKIEIVPDEADDYWHLVQDLLEQGIKVSGFEYTTDVKYPREEDPTKIFLYMLISSGDEEKVPDLSVLRRKIEELRKKPITNPRGS